ncbi:Cof-type HAD-IIB family hydrolase [Alkaliphilus peptidifermentans]|uniref:Cof subfamily of IIB subfamily of haloacid dehalogenase superfamily/HAD-superfamily hydrolase, subfamily IIB n=1 Tax=Alkaliphilus peptidifermentans DSM 18978 TaxID=1120976 RepID=A0A1G5HLG1_9FIRM|nr:Cof-type HAD-IIB family hydrolase [Alkaliphilus peptidifermentans]SCY64606.1 hypothetical protein SAMN03080606_02035 [Alkaliphilus peptidifermentans DSM 18978]
MNIKMLATDMDGTLLKNNKTLSIQNIKALRKAYNSGIEIVICTGRPFATIKPYLSQIGLPCWVVSNNGAVIRNKEEKLIEVININNDSLLHLIPILEKENIYYHGSDGTCSYIKSYRERIKVIKNFIMLKQQSKLKLWLNILSAVFLSGAHKKVDIMKYISEGGTFASLFIYSLDEEKLMVIKEKIKCIKGIELTSSGRDNIEVLHQTASKGSALRRLCDELNINSDEVIAVGDNFNDLSMLSFAGVGVAMENAEEEVLKVADWKTKSNEEDGISFLIETLLHNRDALYKGAE